MSFQRGDVVLIDLLFSDRQGSKKRPAVIVSTDQNNQVLDDVVVASISTTTRTGAFSHLFLDPNSADGKTSGLLHPSYVQCENLFTVDQGLILRKLGALSSVHMHQLNALLKLALELP